jgi:hypothetical protein
MRKETAARYPPTAIVVRSPTSRRGCGSKCAARRRIAGRRRRELGMGRTFIVA